MLFLEIIKSIILGIVEGITEWLPISSTGHIILVDNFISLNMSRELKDVFEYVIQLGAILAVPVYFFERLNPFSKRKNEAEKKNTWNIWFKVIVGIIPAGIIGVLVEIVFEEFFGAYLSSPYIIAAALIIYGIAFIILEKLNAKKTYRIERIEDLTYIDALKIGAFQTLSVVPGTSRSGSTILGGMITGVSRTASAEFSFFMAIPIMLGVSGLKILKFIVDGSQVNPEEILLLFIAALVSFLISLFAIKFLMDFVKRHDFIPFGIYRIILGIVVIAYFVIKALI